MIDVKEITWENFWEVIRLSPLEDQKDYLQDVSVFLAQSYVNLKSDYPDISLAIYKDQRLIGYSKIVYVPKDIGPYYLDMDAYLIDAFLIDYKYQQQGYGRKAFERVLNYIKDFPFGKCEHMVLTCYDDNQVARGLFESYGFRKSKVKNKEQSLYIYQKKI